MVRSRVFQNNVKVGLLTDDYGHKKWTFQVLEEPECLICFEKIGVDNSCYFCENCGAFFCVGCKRSMVDNHWCRSSYEHNTIYFGVIIIDDEKKEDEEGVDYGETEDP